MFLTSTALPTTVVTDTPYALPTTVVSDTSYALLTTAVSLHLVFAHPFRNDGLRSSFICKTKLNGMDLNITTTQNFSRTAGSS